MLTDAQIDERLQGVLDGRCSTCLGQAHRHKLTCRRCELLALVRERTDQGSHEYNSVDCELRIRDCVGSRLRACVEDRKPVFAVADMLQLITGEPVSGDYQFAQYFSNRQLRWLGVMLFNKYRGVRLQRVALSRDLAGRQASYLRLQDLSRLAGKEVGLTAPANTPPPATA